MLPTASMPTIMGIATWEDGLDAERGLDNYGQSTAVGMFLRLLLLYIVHFSTCPCYLIVRNVS